MIRVIRWPFAPARRRGLDAADVQGNVLRPYGHPVAAHVFVHFGDANRARELLRDVLGSITHSDTWTDKPQSTLNVGFTAEGLRALGMPEKWLRTFPAAFLEGMAARAGLLGDTGTSAPEHWDVGFGTGVIHAAFSLYALDDATLDDAIERLLARGGFEVVSVQRARRLPERKEHFGYADGMGQPALAGDGTPTVGAGDMGTFHHWHGLPIGEIFHGHVDADGDVSPGPAGVFAVDGTFLVWRKLYEDAAAFRRFIDEQSNALDIDEQLLRAKLVGRWPDGSPLALTPDAPDPALGLDPQRVNAFDYTDDPEGRRCPLGAHIRRVNPRDGLGFGDALSARQRIVRRGMTYGPPLPPGEVVDDGADRGIHFLAYMADIERQYEFIQANWCNDGDAVGAGHDRDPFVGRAPGDHVFVIPGAEPRFVHPLPELVTTRGGEYLWVPSLRALRALGEGAFRSPPSSARRSRPARFREASDRVLGTALGVALAPLAIALAAVRHRRVVHWEGAGYRAHVDVHEQPDETFDGTVFDTRARYDGIVRLSRGFGRPLTKKDVHGLALRILDAGGPGRHQDLLLASAKPGTSGHELTTASLGFGPRLTSTLRMLAATGELVVIATPATVLPPDDVVFAGGAAGAAFDIAAQFLGGDERTVARVTLGGVIPAEEAAALEFGLDHDGGGIHPVGVLNEARRVAYRASAWGRSRGGHTR